MFRMIPVIGLALLVAALTMCILLCFVLAVIAIGMYFWNDSPDHALRTLKAIFAHGAFWVICCVSIAAGTASAVRCWKATQQQAPPAP